MVERTAEHSVKHSVERIVATQDALDLLARLQSRHGPELLLIQSNGCCDHSPIYCYKENEYFLSPHDVRIGTVGDVPYYQDSAQHALFERTQITISVVPGDRSGDMSLEGTEGMIFRLTSRLFSPEEWASLSTTEARP